MLNGLHAELVWGLIPRFVGLIYIVSFASLRGQALGGSRGAHPVQNVLARVRADYPGIRRFFEYPTLLWVFTSDRALRLLPLIGALCGAVAVYGGPLGYAALFGAWLIWLSMEPLETIFPWDTMLLEVGFLCFFLPVVQPLPSLNATALPLPTVAFMVRWLVLRVMFGFGKDKFLGVRSNDSLYLKGFFVWMPLPSPLGWLGHHAPNWFLKAGHVFMFGTEIFAPVLGLFAGIPRLIAYAALVTLMLAIHATGNWGVFNLGYALLCTCLLDVHSSIFDLNASSFATAPQIAVHALMAGLFVLSLFYLPLNSWTTRTWVHWPRNYAAWTQVGGRIESFRLVMRMAPMRLLRALAPFRIVNGYGVFPPNSSPPIRSVPVFEGSDDGKSWKQYGFRYMPTFADEAPPFIAPIMPRADMFTIYFANGLHSGGLVGSAMANGSPYYSHARSSYFDVTMQRILEHDEDTLRGLGRNPFPEAPPKYVRVGVVGMTPTSPSVLRATGRWWHVRRLGTLVPPTGKESWPFRLQVPEPETFHPDYVQHRRRSPSLRAVMASVERGVDVDRAVLAGSDLVAADVAMFWQELVPMLDEGRGDWASIHQRAECVIDRFGIEGLHRLERVLERFVWVLRCRLERVASSSVEALPISNFRLHMILHEVVLDGREKYQAMWDDPEGITERAVRTTDATQIWGLSLLRYDPMMALIRAFRWSELGLRVHEMGLPGLFEYHPFLSRQVPPEESFCPTAVKHENGEHTIESFYPPSEGRTTPADPAGVTRA